MKSLERFKEAQDAPRSGNDVALAELRAGHKHSHWIWYVFPQLRGLGRSPMADFYGIADLEEADAYLRDAVLRSRLLQSASAALERVDAGVPLAMLMGGEIDTLKLVSSMTLFAAIARRAAPRDATGECGRIADVADALLAAAGREGYEPCAFTRQRLSEWI